MNQGFDRLVRGVPRRIDRRHDVVLASEEHQRAPGLEGAQEWRLSNLGEGLLTPSTRPAGADRLGVLELTRCRKTLNATDDDSVHATSTVPRRARSATCGAAANHRSAAAAGGPSVRQSTLAALSRRPAAGRLVFGAEVALARSRLFPSPPWAAIQGPIASAAGSRSTLCCDLRGRARRASDLRLSEPCATQSSPCLAT
jgi:hypothetical protein